MSINLSFYPVLSRQYVLVRQYGDSIIYPLMSDDEYAISSPEHKYIRINRTAAEILSLCNGEYSISDIIKTLCALYEMENQETIHEIVSDFITDSVDRGYVNMQMKYGTSSPVKIYGDYSMVTPVFACLEVTKRCPLKCKHCYNNSGSVQGYEMNLEEIKQVLTILSEIGVQKLMLTGGEATARTDFIDIVEYAYSKFVAISIASNGYLMDESLIKQLASFRNKIVVQISIDGSEEHHNLIRGKEDSYRKAIRAVKLLRMNSVPVIVATTLNSTNFPDMEAVAKAAYEAGALQIIYAITTDQGRARKKPFSIWY